MKNKLILIVSIFSVASVASCRAADDSWLKYLISFFYEEESQIPNNKQTPQHPQPSAPPLNDLYDLKQNKKHQGITQLQRMQAKQDVETIIDTLFATKKQNNKTQREINAIKEKTVSCINERTQSCNNVQELRNATNYYLVECLTNTVAKNARLLYEQKAAKTDGNPSYNPRYLAERIENEIKAHALKAIKLHEEYNEKGTLVFFVGQPLEKRIAEKVTQDYPVAPKPSVVHPAPAAGDGITEVYLHERSKRYEESIAKIQQSSTYRKSECSVCMDHFGGAKKRATLACGHSICPECLYNWLHQQRKNTCPLCRDTIRADEFPATYLQQFLN